jgi:hypothetical protein
VTAHERLMGVYVTIWYQQISRSAAAGAHNLGNNTIYNMHANTIINGDS